MELFKASKQWANRPADERFSSLQDLHHACEDYHRSAMESLPIPYSSLRTEAIDGEVSVVGKSNVPAKLTHWSFGQLAQRIGAPASYLRDLPPTLAVQNINHGLKAMAKEEEATNDSNSPATKSEEREAKLLLHKNGGMQVHAFTSARYSRIWNDDITRRLIQLTAENPEWQPAPAAFDGSRGLYASDHDVFAFMVDNERRIFEKAHGGLSRGFFVWNSMVGAASFGVMKFMYEYVCGNHIVWGARNVQEIRIRHIGDADDRAFGQLAVELKKYADESANEDEAKIIAARSMMLGLNKDEVLDKLFGLRGKLGAPALTQKLLADSYEKAEEHADWYGDPRSVWGIVNGITEVSRDMAFADKRVEVERSAGKVLTLAF